MPQIAILGATGKLGVSLVTAALEQGFNVHALARDPRHLKRQNEHLTVIKGDAETGEGLDALLERCNYVICAIGSLTPVLKTCLNQLIPRLESLKSLRRFVLVSRLGTGDSLRQSAMASGPIQAHLPVILLPIFRDINAAEAAVRSSRLPYTILRSTRLTDGVATGNVTTTGSTEPPPHRITRADLARFALEVLTAPEWNRKEATVGSK